MSNKHDKTKEFIDNLDLDSDCFEDELEENEEIQENTEENQETSKNAEYVSIADKLEKLAQDVGIAQAIAIREKKRADELDNLNNRLQSDYDNLKRRSEQENKRKKDEGIMEVIAKIIPLVDVIEEAIKVTTNENVNQGIIMMYKKFTDVLESLGVQEIHAIGQEFDPNFHNAVMQEPASKKEDSNKIAEVYQKGYLMGDKIIRHSVVKVFC